ncbi:MAG: hypothetical protein WCY29_16045 [Novosphingobium sp.]
MPVLSPSKRPALSPPKVPALRVAPPAAEPERLVEADPAALRWVEFVRVEAERLAHWQLRVEIAIVTAAAALVIIPAIATALARWWQA